MKSSPSVLATAALLTLGSASCVSYARYEATALAMEKYRALAASRRDTIDEMYWSHLETYRGNERLAHENGLLDTELHSTRTQYTQLQEANADVVERYDRSLALSAYGNRAGGFERQGQTGAATRPTANVGRNEGLRQAFSAGVMAENEDAGVPSEDAERRSAPSEAEAPSGISRNSQARGLRSRLASGQLATLESYGATLTSVTDEGHQYVVRASETMCFAGRTPVLTATGQAFAHDLAAVLRGRERLEVLVHPVSKREGTAAQLLDVEQRQGAVFADALVREGIDPDDVRVLDDAAWSARTTGVGTVASRLDGEVVFVIRVRRAGGLSMG